MNDNAKKTALRMIPYGLYVLMAESEDRSVAAATINWVTQASFAPPLLALGVKTDSRSFAVIKKTGVFTLNILGKGQEKIAYTFFKPLQREGDTIGGEPFTRSPAGAPVLSNTPAWLECKLRESVEIGDHAVVVAEVTEAGLSREPEGRPDDATLWLKDLGETVFYGG